MKILDLFNRTLMKLQGDCSDWKLGHCPSSQSTDVPCFWGSWSFLWNTVNSELGTMYSIQNFTHDITWDNYVSFSVHIERK
jgi:hypothetical protein